MRQVVWAVAAALGAAAGHPVLAVCVLLLLACVGRRARLRNHAPARVPHKV
ncbi:hypothetical protein BC739_001533 [Kutzneria viridogrisea]|uniref:MYXO-CTERM domain-containing protein n=1 Tax=Kutzneria viridogrisea TaxID=47990 RepID=A0ABR6BC79_9PSEU|nr:hypothetical protein [Kutzneria viridogrisea]